MRSQRGLTAIELATVVGLLAVILAVALPIAMSARNTGDQSTARMTLSQVEDALHSLAADGLLPTSPASETVAEQLTDGLSGVASASTGPSSGPTVVSVHQVSATVVRAATFAGPATCWFIEFEAGGPAAWAVDNPDGTGDASVDCIGSANVQVDGRKRAPAVL